MWLGPYTAGIGIAGRFGPGLLWLTLASLGVFLALQPLTILVKALAGRRSAADVRPALFWIAVDGLLAGVGAIGLLASGQARVLWLGTAAIPVLLWRLWLVARRTERGHAAAEVVGAGALALAAPAGYIASGGSGVTGWVLWLLCWLQASGAIAYVYVRLTQRRMDAAPTWAVRWRLARHVLLIHAANGGIAAALAVAGYAPLAVTFAFGVMLLEAVYGGLLRPAFQVKPVFIGVRQVGVIAVFTALLIAAYRL